MRLFGLFALAGLGLARDKYLQRFTVQVNQGREEALRIGRVIKGHKFRKNCSEYIFSNLGLGFGIKELYKISPDVKNLSILLIKTY